MVRAPGTATTDVIERSGGGEERMRLLYELHAQPLYRFLLRITFGEKQAAEDLMQETLLRAWRNLDALNADVGTLRPWLYTVARRVAIDAGRAQQTRPARSGGDQIARLPSREDSIERLLAVLTVRNGLASLSPHHRMVIIQIYFHGLTAAEAGKVLGVPEGTVKSRLHYALRSLRDAVGVTS